jgi:hypothetical protein
MWQESKIPEGNYCYKIISTCNSTGQLNINLCPHHEIEPDQDPQNHGICTLFDIVDSRDGTLLWDSVKECGVNQGDPGEA